MDYSIIKYPRTPHIEGSRLQPGDEDLTQRAFSEIAGRHVVIEEKIDGANTALSFDPAGQLLLHRARPEWFDYQEVWLFPWEGEADLAAAPTAEVCAVRWVSRAELEDLHRRGELVPTLEYMLEL